MISDEEVKRLYQIGQNRLADYWNPNEPLMTQFYRGKGAHFWKDQHPGACERHMSVFNTFNIIPKYCFNCYKVYIEPRTVMELFKLMMVFEKLDLSNDNTRKCIVECREQVSGTYKGFIYCMGIEEGNEMLRIARKVISEEISTRIPVTLKRGCSEYALAYPEYALTEKGAAAMGYKEEWQEYEDLADKEIPVNKQRTVIDTHNCPAYTIHDAKIMYAWLSYAAMIGDSSYLKISGRVLSPVSNVKRPSSFEPVENE